MLASFYMCVPLNRIHEKDHFFAITICMGWCYVCFLFVLFLHLHHIACHSVNDQVSIRLEVCKMLLDCKSMPNQPIQCEQQQQQKQQLVPGYNFFVRFSNVLFAVITRCFIVYTSRRRDRKRERHQEKRNSVQIYPNYNLRLKYSWYGSCANKTKTMIGEVFLGTLFVSERWKSAAKIIIEMDFH